MIFSNWRAAQCTKLRATFILMTVLVCSPAIAAIDLNWDLSYANALNAYPMAKGEFLPVWIATHPNRPIHEKMAGYTSAPIEASVLIEKPDLHAGDPFATWIIVTKTAASACVFHQKFMDRPCQALDRTRAQEFVKTLAVFKPVALASQASNVIGQGPAGEDILLNYIGFVSIFQGGQVIQRPAATLEFSEPQLQPVTEPDADTGRIDKAIARLVLSDSEFAKREEDTRAFITQNQFDAAVRQGDTRRMEASLKAGARMTPEPGNHLRSPALAVAARSGQRTAVDFLVRRGARLDEDDCAALRAAVQASDIDMVQYLLDNGASIDPPRPVGTAFSTVFETPLAVAVRTGNLEIARLLIQKGADVNFPQSRTILSHAVIGRRLPVIDLLLMNGAKPDLVSESEVQTPLMFVVSDSGNPLRKPADEAAEAAIVETEAELAVIVRRLVAAGANVNFMNRICGTAYEKAETRHSDGMMKLLVELGADPRAHERCNSNKAREPAH